MRNKFVPSLFLLRSSLHTIITMLLSVTLVVFSLLHISREENNQFYENLFKRMVQLNSDLSKNNEILTISKEIPNSIQSGSQQVFSGNGNDILQGTENIQRRKRTLPRRVTFKKSIEALRKALERSRDCRTRDDDSSLCGLGVQSHKLGKC